MNIFSKSTLGALVAVASIGFSQVGSAALSSYSQDFNALDSTSNLGPDTNDGGFPPVPVPGEGFTYFVDVWDNYTGVADDPINNPAFAGIPLYNYLGPAPNGGDAFSAVASGEGDGGYLNIYSDYANGSHSNFEFLNSSIKQEQEISAADIGSTWTFSGWFKAPSSGGIDDQFTEINGTPLDPGFTNFFADANVFLKTLDQVNSFNLTNAVVLDTTGAGQLWEQFSISIELLDPLLEGQILQFGFNNVATAFQATGVYYDNLCFNNTGGDCGFTDPNVIPVPAAAWLFGSALLGLAGIGRRRRTA